MDSNVKRARKKAGDEVMVNFCYSSFIRFILCAQEEPSFPLADILDEQVNTLVSLSTRIGPYVHCRGAQ